MTPAPTYTAINRELAYKWMDEFFKRVETLVALNKEIHVEEFSRLAARAFVASFDDEVADYGGYLFDLKKAAAYGLVTGGLDSALVMDPVEMQMQYADRRAMELS